MVPLLHSRLPSMDVLLLHAFTSTQSLPFYRTAQASLLYPPQLLYLEHCLVRALVSHLFKDDHTTCVFLYLNLLESPLSLDLFESSHYSRVCACL